MDTTNTVLVVILAVMIIAYVAKRRSRLHKDDAD
jgi:hypothetical protein